MNVNIFEDHDDPTAIFMDRRYFIRKSAILDYMIERYKELYQTQRLSFEKTTEAMTARSGVRPVTGGTTPIPKIQIVDPHRFLEWRDAWMRLLAEMGRPPKTRSPLVYANDEVTS